LTFGPPATFFAALVPIPASASAFALPTVFACYHRRSMDKRNVGHVCVAGL
jgi:hypothetical protein